MKLPASLLLLALLLLSGCAGGDQDRSRTDRDPASGNSLTDQLDRSLAERRKQSRGPELDAGADKLPEGWRERIDACWKFWVENDPAWPQARQQWVAMGPQARNILVENLIRWHVRAYDLVSRAEVNRSAKELELFRDEATAYVVTGLAEGMGDGVTRTRLEDLLGRFGESVVPAVDEAMSDANDAGQFALVRTLRKTGSRRAVPSLMRQVRRADDFKVRIEAIKGLGELQATESAELLEDCLDDNDVSVRKYAAHYLPSVVQGRPRSALTALIDCMERAIEDGDGEVARTCRRSLGRMVGRDFGARPQDWRNVVRGR